MAVKNMFGEGEQPQNPPAPGTWVVQFRAPLAGETSAQQWWIYNLTREQAQTFMDKFAARMTGGAVACSRCAMGAICEHPRDQHELAWLWQEMDQVSVHQVDSEEGLIGLAAAGRR